VSGPLVTAERPLAMPEKLAPNPIRAATVMGMTHRVTPANARETNR
jgi:hypothetical protein